MGNAFAECDSRPVLPGPACAEPVGPQPRRERDAAAPGLGRVGACGFDDGAGSVGRALPCDCGARGLRDTWDAVRFPGMDPEEETPVRVGHNQQDNEFRWWCCQCAVYSAGFEERADALRQAQWHHRLRVGEHRIARAVRERRRRGLDGNLTPTELSAALHRDL